MLIEASPTTPVSSYTREIKAHDQEPTYDREFVVLEDKGFSLPRLPRITSIPVLLSRPQTVGTTGALPRGSIGLLENQTSAQETKWLAYLTATQTSGVYSSDQVRKLHSIWSKAKKTLNRFTVRIPTTEPGESDSLSLTWSRDGLVLSLDILPDLQLEWFFVDQKTNEAIGSGVSTLSSLPTLFFDKLRFVA